MKRLIWVPFIVAAAYPLFFSVPQLEARVHREKFTTVTRGSDVGACGHVVRYRTSTTTVTRTAGGRDLSSCHHADRGSCAGSDKAACSGR